MRTVRRAFWRRKRYTTGIQRDKKTAITNLENAVKTDFLLDYYIEEFRAVVHWNTGGEDGLTEEQGEELIDYYYRRRYASYDFF